MLHSAPVRPNHQPRIIFITGTDTGVGKTLLTALLVCHLRRTGCRAQALKPFCSGGRGDARLLYTLQDHELTLEQINPFFFPEPLAPLIAARHQHRSIPLRAVLRHIRSATRSKIENQKSKILPPSTLLIEGSGGLLVPLGDNYTVLDLITALGCEVLVVAANRLGTLNHCLLTVRALQRAGLKNIRLALMEQRRPDLSARSNQLLLTELLAPIPVLSLPFLPAAQRAPAALQTTAARLRRRLSRLV